MNVIVVIIIEGYYIDITHRKRYVMTVKRKIVVNTLATIAFIALFLLPVLGFFATETNASSTETAAVTGDGYVFYIVQNNTEVPLAAAPRTDISTNIMWIGLASFVIVMMFVYSTWYVTTQNNIRELSNKMTPFERSSFRKGAGLFFHPIRCHQLAKEAEDTVASMYVSNYF